MQRDQVVTMGSLLAIENRPLVIRGKMDLLKYTERGWSFGTCREREEGVQVGVYVFSVI